MTYPIRVQLHVPWFAVSTTERLAMVVIQTLSVGIELFSEGRPLLHALKATADVGYAMVCLEDLMFNVHLAPAGLPERIAMLSAAGLHNITAGGNKPAE